MTKENLEEYIQKNNTFKTYFILAYLIIYIIIIIIILIKLILSKTNFSMTSYITNGMIYLEEIKSDIYIGSVIVLSQCFRARVNDIPIGLSDFSLQLTIKSSDLMEHLNLFEKQLKLTNNNNLISNIMYHLYKNITVINLEPDWQAKIENSYLLKEFNYFSYLLNEQSSQNAINIKCDFENNFYIDFFNLTNIYDINKEESSFNQRFIYYITMNVIYTFNPLINEIIEEMIVVQIKIMDDYLTKIIIIDSALIFLLIINEVIILSKNILDMNFIKQIFLYLYEYDEKQKIFEYEINYLENVSKEFNLNNLILLENIKKNNYNSLNFINGNNLEENNPNNLRNSLIKNKNNKNSNIIEDMINKYQKIGNEFEQNSFSGSLLNNSMNNNSMMQLINKNNKDGINQLKSDNQKYNKNNKINGQIRKKEKNEMNNNRLNEGDKALKENEETYELLKNNKKIIPTSIIITLSFSIVSTVILIATIVLNLIDIHKKRDIWEYAVNLSMNYLEKIPKLIELGLSTILTVIIGNTSKTTYKTKEEYANSQPKFMRYFTSQKNYDNSELLSSNIKDSFFANELYDNYRIKKNIEFCENDDFFKNYFKTTKYWNKKLNEQNNFCLNAGLKGVLFFNKWIKELYTYFEYVNAMADACILENPKLKDSGLDLEIDLILHELSYLYMDFDEIKNITIARNVFLDNDNFYRMLRDMNIPFTFASGALFSSTKEDMSDLNKIISSYEIIFICVTFIIDLIFLCLLAIIFFNTEKSKKILVFITNILKKE